MSLTSSRALTPSLPTRWGPWLFGPAADWALFGGSAVFALGLVAARHALGWGGDLPEWGWLAFVLVIDVAHVYSTLFRTYLDRAELRRRPARYAGVPLAAYAAGVALHLQGAAVFWRVLAYAALFHFVRQQVGWVAVYRAREGRPGRLDRFLDDSVIYAATLYPVLVWHTRLDESHFAWFVAGDFVDLSGWRAAVPVARIAWVAALVAFLARQTLRALSDGIFPLGKTVVVVTTAIVWYVGIVATNSDFDFTVTNVIVHGVPYVALLYAYARARRTDAPASLGSQIVAGGFGAFAGLLLVLAFVEETAWDRLVWHERSWLFGDGVDIGAAALAWLVPLLAVPQVTHYILDGMLWRRRDTADHPAQKRALGFAVGLSKVS